MNPKQHKDDDKDVLVANAMCEFTIEADDEKSCRAKLQEEYEKTEFSGVPMTIAMIIPKE